MEECLGADRAWWREGKDTARQLGEGYCQDESDGTEHDEDESEEPEGSIGRNKKNISMY